MNLTDMRVIVRRDLHDEDAANYRWTKKRAASLMVTRDSSIKVLPTECNSIKNYN